MIRPLLLYLCFGAVIAAEWDPIVGAIALVAIVTLDVLTQDKPEL